jgi:hypothetical protein
MPDPTTLGPNAWPKAKASWAGLQTRSPGSAAIGAGLAPTPNATPEPCVFSATRLGLQPWVRVWPNRPGQPQHHVSADYGLQPHLACGHLGFACLSARCLQSGACNPTKTGADYFLPNHPFNAIYIIVKKQPHPPPAVFSTLCGKGNSTITLLQSTVLCVYVNSNRGTDPF